MKKILFCMIALCLCACDSAEEKKPTDEPLVDVSKNFHTYDDARLFFGIQAAELNAKYTILETTKSKNDSGEHDDIMRLYEEGVLLTLSYVKSKDGDYFWHVGVHYFEDIINESNDY